ncbi:hypothetical protein Tco_0963261 [Tanacetum coccineum]
MHPKTFCQNAEHVTIVEEVVKDLLVTDFGIRSLGNVAFDQAVNMEAKERSSSFDQKMEEVDFDLESMHDDEIMSMSGNKDEEADSNREFSIADEIKANKLIWAY